MAIQATLDDANQCLTIQIDGRFDFSLHKDFRDAYRQLNGSHHYVIDLSQTEYMDSSALGMLLLLREHAGGDDSNIKITGCRTEIQKILKISNFEKLFEICAA